MNINDRANEIWELSIKLTKSGKKPQLWDQQKQQWVDTKFEDNDDEVKELIRSIARYVEQEILADRKRVCKSLLHWKEKYRGTTEEIPYSLFKSINETLTLAGLNESGK